jgi:HlyD family secretion protein
VRETLVSTLTTNGKIEPIESAQVRSEMSGTLARLPVERGQRVAKGTVLAQLDVSAIERELAEAEAAVAQAQAELKRYEQGGDPSALIEIENGLKKTRVELEIARREAESVARLVAKNAATRQELATARDRVRQLEVEITALERKRAGLLPEGGRTAAEARLKEARAAVALARSRIQQGTVRSPLDGIVYNLPVKQGAFLQPGDLIAEVGQVDRLRAVLYVDEPELGRVGVGMPVAITWDASPGRTWKGSVEKLPSQIVTLGTRQVGEVLCRIGNEDGLLRPGANVNAEIRSATATEAVTIPKEAVRREAERTGVWVLDNGRVRWRDVRLGVASVTRVQVLERIEAGDAVALPFSGSLNDGDEVTSVFPQ